MRKRPNVRPTGQQIEIASGAYAATITEVGATLRSLTFGGRPLIAGFGADEPMPEFNGALLAPWPNRIADGRYDFDGRRHQLPVSEPSRNTALHGLVAWQPWAVGSANQASVELSTVLYPQRGYPFLLTLAARYDLTADGLRMVIAVRNDGDSDAPYGVSMHPWFVAGPEPLSEWRLTLPAGRVLTTDERLLPTGSRPVAGELDFRSGRDVGSTVLDHAFTDLEFTGDVAHATLRSPDGSGVDVSWGRECPWLQVCTGDAAGPELNRRAVAIEPMTCPPDSFRSGEGLVRLAPGQTHEVSWGIAAIG
jgi:aldose 1-epimerase